MSTEPSPSCSSSVYESEESSTRIMENCLYCWAPLDERNGTFYYCRRCPNLKLCSPCYLVKKHEHIMLKCGQQFITTDESEDTEIFDGMEGTTVYMKEPPEEPMTESMKRCLEILSHTTSCTKDPCTYSPCQRMRRVINHARACRRQAGQTVACPICRQLVELTTYHAKTCKYDNCETPYCNRIKEKLKQKRSTPSTTTTANLLVD